MFQVKWSKGCDTLETKVNLRSTLVFLDYTSEHVHHVVTHKTISQWKSEREGLHPSMSEALDENIPLYADDEVLFQVIGNFHFLNFL